MVVLFNRARSFGRDTHGVVREEGHSPLGSQVSQVTLAISRVTDVAARSPSHPDECLLTGGVSGLWGQPVTVEAVSLSPYPPPSSTCSLE